MLIYFVGNFVIVAILALFFFVVDVPLSANDQLASNLAIFGIAFSISQRQVMVEATFVGSGCWSSSYLGFWIIDGYNGVDSEIQKTRDWFL